MTVLRSRTFPLLRLLMAVVLLAGACRSDDEAARLLADDVPEETAVDRTTTTSERTTTTRPASTTSTSTAPPSTTAAPTQTPGGTVVTSVGDGDTFTVRISGASERVRIIGVNAPESGECVADRATAWMRDRIEGRAVSLVGDRSDRDQYGRLLRYVELEDADVGVELVRAGFAVARRYPPDTARAGVLEAAQDAAKAAGVGMWASDACGATSSARLVISEIRFDADGNDNHNLNDEWVRMRNDGSGAVVLTGWVLKDESASHRYGFPSRFSLAAGATVTVRTGCGTDTASDLYWCKSGSAVWNNDGDTAFLLDPDGNIVDSRSG